jgi:hypothetical protein
MKTFSIKISDDESRVMVDHLGLTFDEICRIENFIEDVKHSPLPKQSAGGKL